MKHEIYEKRKTMQIEELDYISKPRINWDLYAKVLAAKEKQGIINFENINRQVKDGLTLLVYLLILQLLI